MKYRKLHTDAQNRNQLTSVLTPICLVRKTSVIVIEDKTTRFHSGSNPASSLTRVTMSRGLSPLHSHQHWPLTGGCKKHCSRKKYMVDEVFGENMHIIDAIICTKTLKNPKLHMNDCMTQFSSTSNFWQLYVFYATISSDTLTNEISTDMATKWGVTLANYVMTSKH